MTNESGITASPGDNIFGSVHGHKSPYSLELMSKHILTIRNENYDDIEINE